MIVVSVHGLSRQSSERQSSERGRSRLGGRDHIVIPPLIVLGTLAVNYPSLYY